MATALKWVGKREEAADVVRKAHEIYEVDSEVLKILAKEFDRWHDPVAIAEEYEKKGEDFIAKRQYDLACDCYTKAIDEIADVATERVICSRLLRRRGECAQQLQDWSLCRRDATSILEQEPDDKTALLQRAASNEALEKFKAALEDARRLLRLDPKHAAANRIVHNCQQALRDL